MLTRNVSLSDRSRISLVNDGLAVKNYLGFFTILWMTWWNTTLYDVRFATDSILERLFKCVHFGVMTAFVFCGPIFDRYDKKDDSRAFDSFAITMVLSRAILAIQYAIVMWQSRGYKNALLPLGLTVLVNALAAIAFGITAIVFPIDSIAWHNLVIW